MAELPTGTVTLLFTDIAGSTQLLQRLGQRYGDVLAEDRP
jgi:class 3 adenylate cyclase